MTRDDASSRGERRSRQLRNRLADELANARLASGLSLRQVGRLAKLDRELVGRIERGEARAMTVDATARVAEVIGLQLAASLHQHADPVRDKAHLALLARFRRRLHPSLAWRTEVAIPITGDLRSADAVIAADWGAGMVEAETRLGDIQLVERRSAAKQRDLGADRLILVVADTRHNRAVIRIHPQLDERFPIDTRTGLARLGKGLDPGGDCLVVL